MIDYPSGRPPCTTDVPPPTAWPSEAAQRLLAGMEPRLRHVLAVGRKAETLPLSGDASALLISAAHLHDIGYSPALVDTGLHQIDGARWLARRGHHDIAALVAHHTCAEANSNSGSAGTYSIRSHRHLRRWPTL